MPNCPARMAVATEEVMAAPVPQVVSRKPRRSVDRTEATTASFPVWVALPVGRLTPRLRSAQGVAW